MYQYNNNLFAIFVAFTIIVLTVMFE